MKFLASCAFGLIAALAQGAGEADGFTSIFDGTLKDWEGDPVYWKAENGILIGEVRPDTLLKRNSFIIWRGGELGDFELKLEYRVSAEGNSGINYRSTEVPGEKWAMRGYQADIDGKDQWSGQNYEERGRKFLAYRGQSVVMRPGMPPQLAKNLGDSAELQKKVKKGDWNEVHIIARGNLLQHFTNQILMSEVRDEDPQSPKSGLLGVQVHVGPPMKIEFKNIRVKRLQGHLPSASFKRSPGFSAAPCGSMASSIFSTSSLSSSGPLRHEDNVSVIDNISRTVKLFIGTGGRTSSHRFLPFHPRFSTRRAANSLPFRRRHSRSSPCPG